MIFNGFGQPGVKFVARGSLSVSKNILCVLFGIVLAWLGEIKSQNLDELTQDECRLIMYSFLTDPLSSDVAPKLDVIMDFLEGNSGTFEVVFRPELLPWFDQEGFENSTNGQYSRALLVGYTCGDVLSQWNTGVIGSDPYSGFIQLSRVYGEVIEETGVEIAGVEKLLSMHQEEKLIDYIEVLKSE